MSLSTGYPRVLNSRQGGYLVSTRGKGLLCVGISTSAAVVI